MLYLSGVVPPKGVAVHPGVGLLLTPYMGNNPPLHATPWAVDTGCFNPQNVFHFGRYMQFLERHKAWVATCLFATGPDVVGDAVATWEASRDVLPSIRRAGFPAALVGQDGLILNEIQWNTFDCLFLGGTTVWKLGDVAREAARVAKQRGKWVHMGRVNSLRRVRYAQALGCDSVDGTHLRYGPHKNLVTLNRWMEKSEERPMLPM